MPQRIVRPLASPRGQYKYGDKIKLEDIQVGDEIMFSTPDAEPKTGKVSRILSLESNALRKRAFLDDNQYVLNLYPDGGTDATFAGPPTEIQRKLDLLSLKSSKKFSKHSVGTIFNQEMVGGPDWLYIKVGSDNWTLIAFSRGGSYDIQQSLPDELVFETLSYENEKGKLVLPNCVVRGRS